MADHPALNVTPPSPEIYLCGPTASGKSALALALAGALDGEIVNADAFQLYRGMPICTAQPAAADFEKVPHHLYGILDLSETCDAARYATLAAPVIQAILSRGKRPIITGGSGLYIKALTHGLSDLPRDEALRQELERITPAQRVERLLQLDPDAIHTVNLKNDRYVTRALEICLLTGRPQSAQRQAWTRIEPHFNGVLLQWPRPHLNARILQRTQAMIAAGLINEVANLPALSSTAAKAIGIREVRAHLGGGLTLAQTIEVIHIATRQYARRQEKWFRRETGFKVLPMTPGQSPSQTLHQALDLLVSPASPTSPH